MEKKDHDTLIRIETQVVGLCTTLEKIDKTNRDEHKSIQDKIDRNYKLSTKTEKDLLKANTTQVQECNQRFVHTKTFLWIAGFIIAGIIGAYSFTAYVQTDLNKHKLNANVEKVTDENRVSIKDSD